ncbi:MAG: ABC transporter substrate-binding protein [Chitinophagaceae bacterium]|nr:ABC transporter substrate-binding protein [Chitinophagaceae bacterium]
MLSVGILLPRSTLFPSLGLDFFNAIKQYLKFCNQFSKVKFITDNIGFGIEEPEIYTKAEKMILQEEADVVIVFADAKIAEMLQPLFTASNKILLVVNFGANLPETWQAAPTTITHSLNFCLHAKLTGKLAAQQNNKQVINTASYYDAGYQICYSMLSGNQQNGGQPLLNHITHLKLDEFTLDPLKDFLNNNKEVNNLLCLFSGEQAVKFYTQISPLQNEFNLNLFVSPMMLDESLKVLLGDAFTINNVKGYIPWHASLQNKDNLDFVTNIQTALTKPANYFSLLGWETGIIVKEILHQSANGKPMHKKL